ncbi:MAG: hypothetical protein IPJ88_15330 [Myxococcales bacterium]|nr:MAG: hypothetical protein IPJ88_15330 [Myxococcales bacterium]
MIWKSHPWKKSLERLAKDFRKRQLQRRWGEASLAKVEQNFFIAAFSIRKLSEGQKLSDEIEAMSLPIVSFKPTARNADLLNWHKLDMLYYLDAPKSARLGLRAFCNQAIHSFIFVPKCDPCLSGFYFSSDQSRHFSLYYLSVDALIETIERVATDDVLSVQIQRDPVTGELSVAQKSNKVPPRSN